MIAYRKFSDTFQNQARAAAAPRPANTPKVDSNRPPETRTLGELGALGGVASETERPAGAAPAVRGGAEVESVAIVDHDGGIPRNWAEGLARLDPSQPPSDVPPPRWQRFVDDMRLFLDSPFAPVAVALGWGPHDLFGCDRDQPLARIDRAGLLWLLHGDRLIAMTEKTATIETPTGARQTYRRKAYQPDRVLAWELV